MKLKLMATRQNSAENSNSGRIHNESTRMPTTEIFNFAEKVLKDFQINKIKFQMQKSIIFAIKNII